MSARAPRAIATAARQSASKTMTLDFGVADRAVAEQFDYFPPELISAAGSLRMALEISRYHAAKRLTLHCSRDQPALVR